LALLISLQYKAHKIGKIDPREKENDIGNPILLQFSPESFKHLKKLNYFGLL
jgi:hypothetical protein